MREFVESSVYFGVFLSAAAYMIGAKLQKKTGFVLFNPLLIAVVITMGVLLMLDIPYAAYLRSADLIGRMLTPATICLAVPLYDQLPLLKKNWRAVMLGIVSGVMTSLCVVLLLSVIFGLDHAMYVTLLPKSITSAIGLGVCEELGGYGSICVAVIILSGILGNMFAAGACRLLRITDPLARGVAIGTSSHAIGTAKAIELGEVEGAMSSLSIVVSGLLTVALAPLFAALL